MTVTARKTAVARELVECLAADRSAPFANAQSVLDDARQLLARLDLPQPTRDNVPSLALTRQEVSDQIDGKLCAEAWRLVGVQAASLADIITKVRYVQEFTQVDETDLESQITLSLCRDLLAIARALSDKT